MEVLINTYWKSTKSPPLTDSYKSFPNIKDIIRQDKIVSNYDQSPDDYSGFPTHTVSYNFLLTLKTNCPNHDFIFTDGSLLNDQTRLAIYVSFKLQSKLPNETVYTAELTALSEAFKFSF